MRVISIKTLREFWMRHPQAEIPLRGWYADVSNADWRTPADIKAIHRNASFLANNRVIFNIKGNNFCDVRLRSSGFSLAMVVRQQCAVKRSLKNR